ncbi:MAG: cytochrome c [Deltaproteobacteria bacterium]|nr:cytochrome c [Deltaproteobacteria bacterium]
MKRGALSLALALGLGAVPAGCRRSPDGLREWTPADHGHGADDPGGAPSGPSSGDPLASAQALYGAQCAGCHGPHGQGDGPQAALFRPADLTDPTLQGSRTDEDLARAITQGRGRMPAFGAMVRPEGVQLLVRLLRSWRR